MNYRRRTYGRDDSIPDFGYLSHASSTYTFPARARFYRLSAHNQHSRRQTRLSPAHALSGSVNRVHHRDITNAIRPIMQSTQAHTLPGSVRWKKDKAAAGMNQRSKDEGQAV